MWLCMNDGFVSVVEDRDDPGLLCVRARRRRDLAALLPDVKIVRSGPGADYAWRAWVTREKLSFVIAERIVRIDYGNFKNSVQEDDLHRLYSGFWHSHFQYQLADPKLVDPKRRVARAAPAKKKLVKIGR